jgi:branched-chain amino acid transport system substrate-binding protein
MHAGGIRCRLAGLLVGFVALTCALLPSRPAGADDVKIGLLFGVTGHFANFTAPLLDAAKLAVDEVNANGGILDGRKLETVLGDTKSTNQGGVEAARKLVDSDHVAAIVGANSSPTTMAVAHAVTIPKGVLTISPSATATVITSMEDEDLVFRLAPSDALQGWVLARLAHDQGLTRVALTYVDNAYGAGVNDVFRYHFEHFGGTVTVSQVHEANKSSYLSELTTLSKYKPQALVVASYAAGGGIAIVKEALEKSFFNRIIGTYSMMDPLLIQEVGTDNLKGMSFTAPTIDPATSAAEKFKKIYRAAFNRGLDKPFIARTYDAMMLTALAIEQAGSTDRAKVHEALRQVCCGPGEVVEPGEWAKAKALIAAGKKINYEGASGDCDFDEYGNVQGVYGHYVVENGAFKLVDLLRP